MTTLVLHDKKEISAEGKRTNGNCKPVFCITTGEIFASVWDAAEANNVYPANLSRHLTGHAKSIHGKKFCFISNVTDHLDEIGDVIYLQSKTIKRQKETISVQEDIVVKYNALLAEQEKKRKAKEEVERRKADYEKKLQALEEAERLLREAEANVKED